MLDDLRAFGINADQLLLFLTFSVLVANPKKLLYTVANPARGLLNREKRTEEKVADQWTTAAQDEGEWRRTAEQGAEHFMAKWIVAEKTKAGLRHAVVCPNVTGRTKKTRED